MDTNYVTTLELASIFKVNIAQINQLIISEGIPFTQYHQRVVLKVDNLIRFLSSRLFRINPVESTLPYLESKV